MIFIFGWGKHGKRERPLIDTHCYHCKRLTTWDWHRVAEYLTLFFVRLLPLSSENYLVCQSCEDCVPLSKTDVRGVRNLRRLPPETARALHDHLVAKLELHQLAGKTQIQRDFIKASRRSPPDSTAR